MLAMRTIHLLGQMCVAVLVLVNVLLLGDTGGTRFLGPLMCQQICEAMLGCSGYRFSQTHLICQVLPDHEGITDASGGWTVRAHSRQLNAKAVVALSRTCAKYSKIFYSRARKLSCASEKTVLTKHEIETLLLLLKYVTNHKQPLLQFHVQDKSFTEYTDPTLKDVKAIGYVSAMRRVMVSLAGTLELSYFTLGSSTVTTIKSNILCTAMSVDVTRNLLVMAIGMPWSAMYTITPDGENYTFIFNISQPKRHTPNYPSALVVDPKRDCVYVCLKEAILSVDLDGETARVLVQCSTLQGVTLDPAEDVLYFGKYQDIFRRSLVTNRTMKVVSSDKPVFNILYYNDYIYVSSYFLKSIDSFHIKNNTRTTHKIFKKDMSIAVLMCVIP